MTHRHITPLALVEALNEGPGTVAGDVEKAAKALNTSERTVHRRIDAFGIQRVYHWELPDEEAA